MSDKAKDEELRAQEIEDLEELEEAVEPVEVSEVDQLKVQLEESEDQLLRARAEMANITKRNRSERELLQRYRSQDLATKLLPSVDNLERALAAEVAHEDAASLKKGVEMVLESLRNALREEGVEEIPAVGEKFDPNFHQAVQTIPAGEDYEADTVVDVLQKGYKLHDRVLRASMVIVAQ